jgi:hypothetical protein
MATTDDIIYFHELWVINGTYSWWKAKHTEKSHRRSTKTNIKKI